jgi:hypothetical protein
VEVMSVNEPYVHKVDWHEWCNQGWIEVKKNRKINKIVFKCSECLTEYESYEDINKKANEPSDRDDDPIALTENELLEHGITHLLIREWEKGNILRNDGVIIKQWCSKQRKFIGKSL